jgi:hypothetical protein
MKAVDKLVFANMLKQRNHDVSWLETTEIAAAPKAEPAKPAAKTAKR